MDNNSAQNYERTPSLSTIRYGLYFKISIFDLSKGILLQMFSLPTKWSHPDNWHSQTNSTKDDQKFCNWWQRTLFFTEEEGIEDSIKLMILIYLCLDESIPKKFINRCQINPDHASDSYRTDIQFYVIILVVRFLSYAII